MMPKRLLQFLFAVLLLLPLGTQAAVSTVWLEDPASVNGATGDASTIHWAAITGTVTFDTTVKNNGLGSWKYNSGATARLQTPAGILADTGARISFYLYLGSLPPSTGTILGIQTSGGTARFQIQGKADGTLLLKGAGAGTLSKAGSTVLSTGTFYRVSMGYTVTSASVFTINVFLNGAAEISATGSDGTLGGTGTNRFAIGNLTGLTWANVYSQNHFVDNRTDNADPGGGVSGLNVLNTTSKRPLSNGTANNFVTQIGAGGSGYGSGHSPQVNERPASDTNGWSVVAVAATTEEYNIEGAAVGDVDLSASTLVARMAWVRAKSLIAETGQIILDNTTSNIALTSTITTFTKVDGTTTYPAGTGTDVGVISSATETTVSLYEAGSVFAYNYVAPSAGVVPRRMLMGVGQ